MQSLALNVFNLLFNTGLKLTPFVLSVKKQLLRGCFSFNLLRNWSQCNIKISSFINHISRPCIIAHFIKIGLGFGNDELEALPSQAASEKRKRSGVCYNSGKLQQLYALS
ncbi:hypothetical protein QVD17_38212 [Tagetes erecta]|uniref:Uncharacterized protein n=1 Tax=Tagetes erecta TaxID=13708 RepID=A0AAD8K1Y7_TARER|nr:hypothetical protein QVD17_38212 [Tagetes erecta]